MKYEVGEKLYCIKDYITAPGAYFLKGNWYEIDDIVGIFYPIFTVWLVDFLDDNSEWGIDSIYLSNHFCSKKELRKEKLEKLNVIRIYIEI